MHSCAVCRLHNTGTDGYRTQAAGAEAAPSKPGLLARDRGGGRPSPSRRDAGPCCLRRQDPARRASGGGHRRHAPHQAAPGSSARPRGHRVANRQGRLRLLLHEGRPHEPPVPARASRLPLGLAASLPFAHRAGFMELATRYAAIFRPMSSPTTNEFRKWIPPQMRTSACSWASCAMLVNCRVRRGSARSLTVKVTGPVPNTDSRMPAPTPPTMAAAAGYSGCIGLAFNDVQPASLSVASLPSRSPLRIAVTGRQRLYRNLASQSAMNTLAMPMLSSARSRALSASPSFFAAESSRAAWFQLGPKLVWAQKRTASACWGVRLVLFAAPSSLVSL